LKGQKFVEEEEAAEAAAALRLIYGRRVDVALSFPD
jgi:hypothetical protein